MNSLYENCKIRSQLLLILVIFIISIFGMTAEPAYSQSCQPGDCMDQLSEDQKVLAGNMLLYLDKTEQRFFSEVERLNGKSNLESKSFESDTADFEITVLRGEIIEKAGLMISMTKKGTAPFVKDPIWSRYIEIDIHPKTPLVGLLHITVNFAYAVDGTSTMAGWIDLIPAADASEDLDLLSNAVDGVFSEFGIDPAPYREWLCASLRKETVNTACAGVSFYKRPMMGIEQTSFELITDVFDVFLDTYLTVLTKRSAQPFTDNDLKIQNKMRIDWLKDHLIDPYPVMLVPPEVWFMAHQAPVLRF